jgi:hypothetical protein
MRRGSGRTGAVTRNPPEAPSSGGFRLSALRPGGLGAEPPGVVAGGDEEQRGGVRADPVQGEQPGGAGGDEGDDKLVEALELAVEELRAPAQLAQREPGGVADDVAGPGPQ